MHYANTPYRLNESIQIMLIAVIPMLYPTSWHAVVIHINMLCSLENAAVSN